MDLTWPTMYRRLIFALIVSVVEISLVLINERVLDCSEMSSGDVQRRNFIEWRSFVSISLKFITSSYDDVFFFWYKYMKNINKKIAFTNA